MNLWLVTRGDRVWRVVSELKIDGMAQARFEILKFNSQSSGEPIDWLAPGVWCGIRNRSFGLAHKVHRCIGSKIIKTTKGGPPGKPFFRAYPSSEPSKSCRRFCDKRVLPLPFRWWRYRKRQRSRGDWR